MRVCMLRLPAHAKATETSRAKNTMAPKWLRCTTAANTQPLRPRAIPNASITANRFTMPDAAMKRVP